MTWLAAFLAFAAGIALGWRLPAWREAWRAWRRRRAFRPALLQPYFPPPAGQGDEEARRANIQQRPSGRSIP